MKVIGLTGGSGAGKGEVSKIFAKLGAEVIDTDKLYHEMTSQDSPCLREIAGYFTEEVIKADGGLDRRELREIVFYDKEKLAVLNGIAHKHILRECREIITKARIQGKRAVVVDAPLLYESGFDKECDIVVAVTAERSTRLERIMRRDNISAEDAERRLSVQQEDEFYAGRADYIIDNEEGSNLREQVERIYKLL